MSSKLLPVAIMAHDEEKGIEKSVNSVLSQNTPFGYSAKVIVVANGCTDRTEEIVQRLEQENQNRVVLVSIEEKGKTRAINKAISFLEQISNNDVPVPYVIFLDADCEFIGKEALVNFVKKLEERRELCAVAADCLPDVLFKSRKDIVSEIYRATYRLGESLKVNSLSGMCYGIRFDVLKKINFPEFQFAEDMYISSRIDGRFIKDRNIQIVFKTPSNLINELNRRTRQEISTQRYHEYYSYLKRRGGRVKLFEKALGNEYKWGATRGSAVKAWVNLKGAKPKFFVILYYLIRIYARTKAYLALKKMQKNGDLDYWKVLR